MLQQQHDWIPLDFRPLFIPHRVSRVPHLRVRQALRAVICSGYCSVISRFRFSLSFLFFPLPLFFLLIKGHAFANRGTIIGNTGKSVYLSDQGSLSKAFVGGWPTVFPSSCIWNFNRQPCYDRPYFPIYHTFFKDRLMHLSRSKLY